MVRYLITRLVGVAGVLLAVSLITFFLMKAVPAGPFDWSGRSAVSCFANNIFSDEGRPGWSL